MTVYYNPKRERWLFDFEYRGKRFAGYCLDQDGAPVTSKKAALQAEAIERRRASIDGKIARPNEVSIAQVAASLIPKWKGKDDWQNKQRYLREVLDYFGRETAIASISEAKAADLPDYLLKQPMLIWIGGSNRKRDDPDAAEFWKPSTKPRSAATVNRYLPVARMIFDRAHKMRDELNRRIIEIIPEIKDLQELKRKPRPIPDKVTIDIAAIAPAHIIEAATATLFFGFRRAEIFSATIEQVDFELGGIWLDAEDTKDSEDAFMPGAPEAMEFMRNLVDQAKARGVKHLITWRRYHKDPEAQEREPWVPIKRPKRAWSRIMKAIEKKHGRRFRWHDLRAAYITQVARTSGGIAAQALARHSDFATTQAYIEIADEDRRAAAAKAANRPALAHFPKPKPQTDEAADLPKAANLLK